MMLVMVCDLPVPGGPCSMKLLFCAAAQMASSWVASALMGRAISDGR